MTQRAKRPPPPGSERRQHPRYELLVQVELRGDDTTWLVPMRNISAGGAYVELESPDAGAPQLVLAAGERVTVFIDLDAAELEGAAADALPADAPPELLSLAREAEILRIDVDHGVNTGALSGRPVGMALRWTEAASDIDERFERFLALVSTLDISAS
ncbi:PilZ domain-containing protein [Haliangium ochraceum]|uniref:Type IV pilus assembly PilZ n=1 Tax=Haliangium ochraceum (strain DSM 14365 / JCM 11303 / SMP-2) TaxID=502025 RepID=D0LKZ5_HALO1|nr:PilZ domain-containing protein [Haliangium ochraceum]ACY16715.1 type IV pilus assembly PilZ [Haliangium ochraceum DSM 14365]